MYGNIYIEVLPMFDYIVIYSLDLRYNPINMKRKN